MRRDELDPAARVELFEEIAAHFRSQVEFPAGGVYYVEVLVDDVMKIRFPLPVLVVQPPQQGAQQAPAKQEPQS